MWRRGDGALELELGAGVGAAWSGGGRHRHPAGFVLGPSTCGLLDEGRGCVTLWKEEEKQKVRSEAHGSKEPFSYLEERQMPWD